MSETRQEFPGAPGARRHKRDSLLLMGTISAGGDRSAARDPIRIRNLSRTGLMGACEVSFGEGCAVDVEIRGIGIVTGRIAWNRKGRLGMSFDSPVDPKLARMPAAADNKDRLWRMTSPRVAGRPASPLKGNDSLP